MAEPIQIRRYPNRRFYSRNESRYVSLEDIEEIVRSGRRIEVRDSQTDEDLTRVVLTRVLIEKNPEKMALFPVELLHFILRSNDVMADFLRDYFRHSLTYLDYLQRHSAAVPMHWVQAWLESLGRPAARVLPRPPSVGESPGGNGAASLSNNLEANSGDSNSDDSISTEQPGPAQDLENEVLRRHIQKLEERIQRLEKIEDRDQPPDT